MQVLGFCPLAWKGGCGERISLVSWSRSRDYINRDDLFDVIFVSCDVGYRLERNWDGKSLLV